jgi:serine/threonine-protein kinase
MALANDGRFVVYSAIAENPGPQAKPQVYLRQIGELEPLPVAGTEGGMSPFLSPDDRWIGFWQEGKLRRVSVGGGVPATLCEARRPFGADWGPNNTIVFCPGMELGLFTVSADGGEPHPLTVPDKAKGEFSHRLPRYLPNGRGVLFTVMAYLYDLQPRLALLDLQTGNWRVLVQDATDGRYLQTGQLLFLRRGTLMAVAFDLNRQEVKGRPVPVVGNLMQALNVISGNHNTGAGQYNVSGSGWLAYVPGGIRPDDEHSLVRVDYEGSAHSVVDFKAAFSSPRFSPDGKRIAYSTSASQRQVWIFDTTRGTATRFTGDG